MLKSITPSEARANFYKLIEEVNASHEPVYVNGRQSHKSVIMIAEEDWRSIQETMYLLSTPKVRKKILKGGSTPVEKCSEDLPW